MLLTSHLLTTTNDTSYGIICKYMTVISGKQQVNRLAIMQDVAEIISNTYPQQMAEALETVRNRPSKLKDYVYIEKRMFDLLTRYMQRSPITVDSNVKIRVNIYLINNKLFVYVFQVHSRYKSACGLFSILHLSKVQKMYNSIRQTPSTAPEPTTLGELIKAHVGKNRQVSTSLTIDIVVNKVQTAIKDGIAVLYCKQAIRDIGLCNAIEPQIFLFKTEGMIVKKLSELQIDEFAKSFTYIKTENLF